MEKKHQWTEVDKQENPYKVPEGYFDNFTERMMAALPEVEETPAVQHRQKAGLRTWMLRLSPVIGAAAILVCAVVYQHDFAPTGYQGDIAKTQVVETQATDNNLTQAADAAYDYLMLDNMKIYDYEMEEYE